jgi:hypothetical protein
MRRFRSAKKLAVIVSLAAMLPGSLARASGGGEGGGEATPIAPNFVPMPEISVPIVDGGQLIGVLRYTLVLRATDAAAAHELTTQVAKLRSAALGAGIDFASLRASPQRPVDVANLAASLDAAMHAANPAIKQALIVKVMASPA